MSAMTHLSEEYTRLLQSLLPQGPAWDEKYPLVKGLAPSLARVHQHADNLMTEINPAQSVELIDRYEKLCGLPDKCLAARKQTLEERQQVLDAKVNTVGGINEAFFAKQLEILGYPSATIEQFQHLDSTPDPAWGDKWRYYWRVNIPAEANTRWMTCISDCTSPIRTWGDSAVECVIERLCPSHTNVIFAYPKEEVMHRIDTPTAQKDKFGQGKNGFTNGDPTTGTPSTGLDENMWDALQEEICTVIERSGIKLNKDQHDQLYKAIRKLSTEDLSKALLKAQNLADLPDKGAARSHLEVYSQSQTDGKYFPKTGGTVDGDVIVEGSQLLLKGDNRKHLGFHNQDGSVRMWLYKDKGGDGVHLNNGEDGGGDWVFNKNGHFYSPQALHAAGATYQEDGNVHGAAWGGHLSGWLNNTFVRDIRLGGLESVMAWNGPGYVDQGGYVLTGAENGNRDAYIDRIYRRPLQKNINGNWMNVGSI